MRHKFMIKRNESKKELRIREYANLEREPKNEWQRSDAAAFSLIGEETYGKGAVTMAIEKGKRHLISVLRTHNMYPIGIYAEEIACPSWACMHRRKSAWWNCLLMTKPILKAKQPFRNRKKLFE